MKYEFKLNAGKIGVVRVADTERAGVTGNPHHSTLEEFRVEETSNSSFAKDATIVADGKKVSWVTIKGEKLGVLDESDVLLILTPRDE
jgi:hypothetical protein